MGLTTRQTLGASAAGLLVAALGARAFLRNRRHINFCGKRVLVSGGSRGLGLVIARQLAEAGAQVALSARDGGELARAADDVSRFGRRPLTFVCDVRDEAQVQGTVQKMVDAWGGVDVVFNVAGIISVGPFEAMATADFYQAMEVNCWGALLMTKAVHPHMQRQGFGRIVNIASLGGKRAVPHMLPYAASKFALVGLSTGLRTELAKDGILVTTVCPGLMRTGSPRHASFKGNAVREFAWFSLGDSLPLLSVAAEDAAKKIVKACQRGDAEATVSFAAPLVSGLQALMPNLSAELFTLMAKVLPAVPDNALALGSHLGMNCGSWASPSWMTTLSDEAAARNNEVRPL